MISQLLFGWLTKDGEEQFSGKVSTGIQGMTGNTYFTTLATEVTAADTAYATYLLAKADAVRGGVEQTAIRNARRGDLVDLLRGLLSNINAVANGDAEKLLSSGFPLRKTVRTPVGPLQTPATPVVRQGPTTCTLKASTPPIYGASLYTTRLALASAPLVYLQTKQSTAAHFLFDGLTAGELYNVGMNAIGAAGPSDWSNDGTCRIV
jgi:hypothetical protein